MIKLKDLREEKKILQKEIASLLSRSSVTVGDWERGRTEPSIADLIVLANYFDVTVDYLIGRTDDFGFVPGQNGASLSADELALVEAYRKLPEKRRDAILDTVITLAKVN